MYEVSTVEELIAALEADEPRIVRSLVDTVFDGGDVLVEAPADLTWEDTNIKQITVRINSNTIVQDCRIRYEKPSSRAESADCLHLNAGASNILIDHCSLYWSHDELLSIYADNVTVQYCILAEPLTNAGHPESLHAMALLVPLPEFAKHVTVHHCLFYNSHTRHPEWHGAGYLEFVYNVLANTRAPGDLVYSGSDATVVVDYANNTFVKGANSETNNIAARRKDAYPNLTIEAYIQDNVGVVTQFHDQVPGMTTLSGSPQIDQVAADEDAYDRVLYYAGARSHGGRDTHDVRVAALAYNEDQNVSLINTQDVFGGWY